MDSTATPRIVVDKETVGDHERPAQRVVAHDERSAAMPVGSGGIAVGLSIGYAQPVKHRRQSVVVARSLCRGQVDDDHVPGIVTAQAVAGEDEVRRIQLVITHHIAREDGAVTHLRPLTQSLALVDACLITLETAIDLHARLDGERIVTPRQGVDLARLVYDLKALHPHLVTGRRRSECLGQRHRVVPVSTAVDTRARWGDTHDCLRGKLRGAHRQQQRDGKRTRRHPRYVIDFTVCHSHSFF